MGHPYFLLSRVREKPIPSEMPVLRLALLPSELRLFGALAHVLVDIRPANDDTLAVIVLNEAETGVTELDDCIVAILGEAVLHVVGDGVGHHERSAEFEKRGALDGLHGGPVVAVAIAEVAIPASAWQGL